MPIALTIILFAAISALLKAQNPTDTLTITGRVTNQPHIAYPPTEITAKDPETGQVLATAQTDENGLYQLQVITDIGTSTVYIADNLYYMHVIPNPFGRYATLKATLPASGAYTLSVTDLYGRNLLTERLLAAQGLNHIPITLPTSSGIVTVTLHSPHFHQTTKAIQLPHIQSTNIYPGTNTVLA